MRALCLGVAWRPKRFHRWGMIETQWERMAPICEGLFGLSSAEKNRLYLPSRCSLILVCLLFLGCIVLEPVAAQETVEPFKSAPAVGPPPSPQERILSPIPEQFGWINREVRSNPLLESLLSLQEAKHQLFVSTTLAERYSDNFSQVEDEPDYEFRTSATLGTTYRLEGPKGFVSLANTIDVNYNARTENEEFGFVNLSLNVGYQAPRLALALSESLIRDDDPSQADPSGIRRGRRIYLRNQVSPQVHYRLSRLTTVSLRYTNILVDSDGGGTQDENSFTHEIAPALEHRITRRLSSRAHYTFVDNNNDDGSSDEQSHNILINLGYVLSRLTNIGLRGFGMVVDRSSGGVDSQTYGGSFEVRQQLSPLFVVFVAVGATVFDLDNDNAETHPNWRVALDGNLPFSRHTRLTLNSQQRVRNTAGAVDNVGIILSRSISLALSHVFSRAFQGSLTVSYVHTEQLEDAIGTSESVDNREDDFWNAGVRIAYAITRSLSLSVSYLHQQRDSNLPDSNFTENRVDFNLSGHFSLL